ncbi:hypothetical protein DN069_33555 [Streptacidiphilus pinicola]|uniref:Uncharacterized protein n=1 Tax=Streptacidiphilus pinicola TaxID=2219663 RepID=A0A2X0K1B8_9ACTN|nr:hypothetical protein [Streptacidiphilus pinicola]RAG81319.1 hypothetical protein DN069_33555 [Streptacidiphilus pinicola]
MSLLYEVLEPLPDAESALRRARGLLSEFAAWTGEPEAPELGPVVTAEQFGHARQFFGRGEFRTRTGHRFPETGLEDFWSQLARLGVPRGDDPFGVEMELAPELESLWPLPPEVWLEVGWRWKDRPPPFKFDTENCSEADVDVVVAAIGPLALDVQWHAALRGLPASKLCGVQLCLNSVWTMQCAEPSQGTHGVYLSIGTKNRDVQEEWLAATGLTLGEPLVGW